MSDVEFEAAYLDRERASVITELSQMVDPSLLERDSNAYKRMTPKDRFLIRTKMLIKENTPNNPINQIAFSASSSCSSIILSETPARCSTVSFAPSPVRKTGIVRIDIIIKVTKATFFIELLSEN